MILSPVRRRLVGLGRPRRDDLAGFVTASDAAIAEAMRLVLASTHSLVEGAGAAGLAGLLVLRRELAGPTPDRASPRAGDRSAP